MILTAVLLLTACVPALATEASSQKLNTYYSLAIGYIGKEEYDKALSDIRNGKNVDGEEIQTLTVIIKPTDVATYDNMVQALDEMLVCSIGKYVIDKVNEDDQKLLELKGIKFSKD